MTDSSRQLLVDKITALNGQYLNNHLHYHTARREAYIMGAIDRVYLGDMNTDLLDTSDWNAMVEWENANTLLAIYDHEGPDAATLWKLSNP